MICVVVGHFIFRLILWQILLEFYNGDIVVDPKYKDGGAMNFERHRIPVRFTEENKNEILRMHNEYRSEADPPAGNMRLMRWDKEAEKTAELWAKNCQFEHGMPIGYEEVNMGQNLYIGSDRTGYEATELWWKETVDYNLRTHTCRPDQGVMCGHYTQIMWATSDRLGCGIYACPNWNLIVCHYLPPGNYKGEKPYIAGKSCSQCNTNSGGRCNRNLCVKDEECKGLECSCPLQCHNCGVVDKEKCRCVCKDGWDSLDCSKRCENVHPWCLQNPGFPSVDSCNRDYRIKDIHCRAMCGQCNATPAGYPKLFFDPDVTGESGNTRDVCCRGVTCPDGYILDMDFCECAKLCPGPQCDNGSRVGFSLLMIVLPLICIRM